MPMLAVRRTNLSRPRSDGADRRWCRRRDHRRRSAVRLLLRLRARVCSVRAVGRAEVVASLRAREWVLGREVLAPATVERELAGCGHVHVRGGRGGRELSGRIHATARHERGRKLAPCGAVPNESRRGRDGRTALVGGPPPVGLAPVRGRRCRGGRGSEACILELVEHVLITVLRRQ